MTIEKEELLGLAVLLAIIVGLSLCGKLTADSVEGIKWVGGAFFLSKGMGNLLPDQTPPQK